MDAIDEIFNDLFGGRDYALDHTKLDAKLYKLGFTSKEVSKLVDILIQRVNDPKYFIEAFKTGNSTRHRFRKRNA